MTLSLVPMVERCRWTNNLSKFFIMCVRCARKKLKENKGTKRTKKRKKKEARPWLERGRFRHHLRDTAYNVICSLLPSKQISVYINVFVKMNYKLQDSNIKTTEIGLNIGQLVWRQHIGWKPVERIMVIAAYFTRPKRAFFSDWSRIIRVLLTGKAMWHYWLEGKDQM